ncbi:MAG: GyrI-like domain-containing protein [Chloroflexota bacterium]
MPGVPGPPLAAARCRVPTDKEARIVPTFEIQQRAPRPALAIPLHSNLEEISATLGVALAEVWHAAEAAGRTPEGPPFTRYFSEPDGGAGNLDYEAGVTLLEPASAGQGRALPTELPGGTLAVGWHMGPYDTIGETYGALMGWIGEQGRTVAGPMWEVYWTNPDDEPDPALWRTEVIVPVA